MSHSNNAKLRQENYPEFTPLQPDNNESLDSTSTNSLDDWKKLPEFLEANPQFSEVQMRGLLLRREQNGLSEATRKIGKPIYISQSRFTSWLENYSNR